jgi:hypothetical protein
MIETNAAQISASVRSGIPVTNKVGTIAAVASVLDRNNDYLPDITTTATYLLGDLPEGPLGD